MSLLIRLSSAFFVAGALFLPGPAAAGGGNWINFDEEYNAVGSEVDVYAAFYADKAEMRAHAPFYVYLERLEYTGQGWDLPKVGEPGVHRVAEVDIDWDVGPRFLPGGSAQATFEVPDVRRGRYLMSICDRNCRHSLGDIDVTGYIRIVGTPAEARALTKTMEIRERFRMFRSADHRRDTKMAKRHQAELDAAQWGQDMALADLNSARDTIWVLRSDVNAARAGVADAQAQRNVAVIGLLLAIGIAAAWAMRRRRTDLQVEAVPKDVREGGGRDLFEFVGRPDGGLLDIADLTEVDRRSDKDHVGVR